MVESVEVDCGGGWCVGRWWGVGWGFNFVSLGYNDVVLWWVVWWEVGKGVEKGWLVLVGC